MRPVLLAESASEGRRVRMSPALPIAEPSRLERRIKAIVRSNRPRRGAFVTAAVLTAFGVGGLFASCADPVPVTVVSAGDSTSSEPEAKRRLGVAPFGGKDCPLASARAREERVRSTRKQEFPKSLGWDFKPRMALLCMAVGGDVVMSRDARGRDPLPARKLRLRERCPRPGGSAQGPGGVLDG